MKAETQTIRQRYDRIAPCFDVMEGAMERLLFSDWRQRFWCRVEPGRVLELGVGTGKNFPYYPSGIELTAIDFSAKMLVQAQRKAARQHINVDLRLMDIQCLEFADNSFDVVVGTFVFCSVPEPLQGLHEVLRVLKPGGQLYLLEHVLSSKPWLAALMNGLNPLVVTLVGANINRNTLENVRLSGFTGVAADAASSDLIKLIAARKPLV